MPLKRRCQLLGLETPNKRGSCPDGYGMRKGCCAPCTTCPPGQGTSPVQGVSQLHTVLSKVYCKLIMFSPFMKKKNNDKVCCFVDMNTLRSRSNCIHKHNEYYENCALTDTVHTVIIMLNHYSMMCRIALILV